MGEKTKISWATSSWSPWIGCSKVHTGCANCYARAMSGRLGVTWGPSGTRRRTAESSWWKVEAWNRKAACRCGADDYGSRDHLDGCPQLDRPRVFPSLCDVFERWDGPILNSRGAILSKAIGDIGTVCGQITMNDVRRDFFDLIDRCPNLDFLLLTKRPENIWRMWPGGFLDVSDGEEAWIENYRQNCWLLYSASDQASLDAGLPHLLACRDLVPVLGLSLEPLVGRVHLGDALASKVGFFKDVPSLTCNGKVYPKRPGLDFVIVGGESGPKARPCDVSWIRSIVSQCREAGVPCWVKQMGANSVDSRITSTNPTGYPSNMCWRHKAGADPSEWPKDLRVQQRPSR